MTKHKENKNLTLHTYGSYLGLPVQCQRGALILNYLDGIYNTIQLALAEHSRLLCIRVDFHLPFQGESVGSTVMSKFIASLKSQIKADLQRKSRNGSRVHACKLHYIWVKEQASALREHYHVLLLVNRDSYNCLGDFNATSGNMAARIKRAWGSAIGYDVVNVAVLIHFPINPIYAININSSEYQSELEALFYRASYMAKAATKNFGNCANAFGCSRK